MFILRLIKRFLRILNSNAAPWQIALGAFLGMLLGLMPLWPSGGGPNLLGWTLLFFGLLINCHLASMLFFLGLGSALHLLLIGPGISLGNALWPLAAWSADIGILHASHWSHTGYLGLTLFGLVLAPLAALSMHRLTVVARRDWLPKIAERKRLMKAGKIAGNTLVLKVTAWFFGL